MMSFAQHMVTKKPKTATLRGCDLDELWLLLLRVPAAPFPPSLFTRENSRDQPIVGLCKIILRYLCLLGVRYGCPHPDFTKRSG